MRKLLLIATLSLSLATLAFAQEGGADEASQDGPNYRIGSGAETTPGSNQPGVSGTESNPQTGSQYGTENQPGSMGSSTGQGTMNNGTTGTTNNPDENTNNPDENTNNPDENMNSAPSSQ